jgi:hypothetical protein
LNIRDAITNPFLCEGDQPATLRPDPRQLSALFGLSLSQANFHFPLVHRKSFKKEAGIVIVWYADHWKKLDEAC